MHPEKLRPKILFVDDESMIVLAGKIMLENAGYEVVTAQSGAEALQCEVQPDCAILDVVMPGMSGPETCAKLRERWPGLPVLFISGYTQEGLESTNSRFLLKPFRFSALADLLKVILSEGVKS